MNLQLSDGTTMQVPDDATPEMIRNFSARGEAHIKSNPAPAAAAGPNPYGAYSTAGRVATDAVLGIPDLGIAAYNAFVADEGGRVKPLGERARSAIGVEELPEDAPWYRRLLESGASALPTGGAGIVRSAAKEGLKAGAKTFGKTIVAPTILSDSGAQVGGAIGGEKGALIGGVLGGAAPSAKPLGDRWVQGRYVGKGDANAPAIWDASQRLGIEPTAGALGNYDIQKRENAFAANYPGGLAAREQVRVRNEMTGAGENLATQRGATGASVAEIGDDIRSSTADRLRADRMTAQQQQQAMQDRVGVDTQIPVTDISTALDAGTRSPANSAPQRENYEYRRDRHLNPIINRDQAGVPILDAQGNVTAPYGALKQFGTDLGRSYDQGRYPPASTQVYGTTADTIGRGVESQAGVPRADYNAMQRFYQGVEGEGGLRERLEPYDKDPQAAYNYLETGRQNPERAQVFADETAGDPRQNRVFGNYLQQKVGDTLGRNQAQSANKFAQFVEGSDPRFIDTVAGPQAPGFRDLATVARGVDTPTSQRGLATSVGGVAGDVGNKVLGSGLLGQLFGNIDPTLAPVGYGLGWAARPALAWVAQKIEQSDAAKRGMRGAPMLNNPMSMQDLVHILNTIGQNQPRQVQ